MELDEEITAYVDDEVKDFPVKCRLGELINLDFPVRKEYLIQKKIKDLLKQKFSEGKVPVELKSKILAGIFQIKLNRARV